MSFKDIIGHKIVVSQFRNAIASGRVGHAYLFSGPSGIGKKLMAVNLAKALNCLKNDPDGCDSCESCRKIDASTHPDVKVYGPAGASRTIKIELIRELSKNAYLMPYEAKRKVFIISDVDTLNPASGNAVLKTLEEPPSDTVLILTTSFKDSILPTIRSRCQIIDFQPLPLNYIEDILRKRYNLAGNDLKLYAAMSGGRIGRTEVLMKGDYFARRERILSAFSSSKFETVSGAVSFVEELIEDLKSVVKKEETRIKEAAGEISDADEAYLQGRMKEEIFETINIVYLFLRDLLVYKVSQKCDCALNYDKLDLVKNLSGKFRDENIERGLKAVAWIKRAIDGNANLKLALEVMFLKLGRTAV